MAHGVLPSASLGSVLCPALSPIKNKQREGVEVLVMPPAPKIPRTPHQTNPLDRRFPTIRPLLPRRGGERGRGSERGRGRDATAAVAATATVSPAATAAATFTTTASASDQLCKMRQTVGPIWGRS